MAWPSNRRERTSAPAPAPNDSDAPHAPYARGHSVSGGGGGVGVGAMGPLPMHVVARTVPRARKRRVHYTKRFKELAVAMALSKPHSARIKPTCSELRGMGHVVEPVWAPPSRISPSSPSSPSHPLTLLTHTPTQVQLRKWIRTFMQTSTSTLSAAPFGGGVASASAAAATSLVAPDAASAPLGFRSPMPPSAGVQGVLVPVVPAVEVVQVVQVALLPLFPLFPPIPQRSLPLPIHPPTAPLAISHRWGPVPAPAPLYHPLAVAMEREMEMVACTTLASMPGCG